MKKIIRLTESDLHRMIKKSVNKILKEDWMQQGGINNQMSNEGYDGHLIYFHGVQNIYDAYESKVDWQPNYIISGLAMCSKEELMNALENKYKHRFDMGNTLDIENFNPDTADQSIDTRDYHFFDNPANQDKILVYEYNELTKKDRKFTLPVY
jgi:hypothetical protein